MTSSSSSNRGRLGVDTNLDPTAWHGQFDCSGPCKRARLPAVEFSNAQLKKIRAHPETKIVCAKCIQQQQQQRVKNDLEASEVLQLSKDVDETLTIDGKRDDDGGLFECSVCKQHKAASDFARSQLRNKGPGKQKCTKCASEADAKANPKKADVKTLLEEAREASRKAELTNAPDKLKIFAREAALEAEAVTGLKPKRIGGRGRGRGRGRETGRGRSGGERG